MGLSTASKIAVARLMYRAVMQIRRLGGRRGSEVLCRRRGVRWSLDLSEGVQFGIYTGLYERETSRVLSRLAAEGDFAVDIGANVGAHTLTLAGAVGASGRVVAIEPTDAAFARLLRNRELNPEIAGRIIPVQAALGAPGDVVAPGYYSAWGLADSGPRHPVHLGTRQPAAGAQQSTLDLLARSMNWPRVALIKLDVDGAELSVLRGAVGVIERDRPAVLFEFCPYLFENQADPPQALLEFFTSRGYRLLDERTLRPVGADWGRLLQRIPRGGGINLVAMAPAAPQKG